MLQRQKTYTLVGVFSEIGNFEAMLLINKEGLVIEISYNIGRLLCGFVSHPEIQVPILKRAQMPEESVLLSHLGEELLTQGVLLVKIKLKLNFLPFESS